MQISIYEYMDIRQYLQDKYNFRKKQNTSFSYTVWARELGFNNKTLLRLILKGQRNISLQSQLKFINHFKLNSGEKEYFQLLIDYTQTKSPQQRQLLGSRLIQIIRQHYNPSIILHDSNLVSDVYGPLILTLINSSDYLLKAEEIADYLSVDLIRVEKVLHLLIQQNLVEQQDVYYSPRHSTFKISDNFGNSSLLNYYRFWFKKSAEALDLPTEVRRFKSLQLFLSENEFNDFVNSYNDLILSLLTQASKSSTEKKKLYLFNSALFPVTEKIDSK